MSKIIGYTTGVFDLFHVGHLNILKKSKEFCDILIVGVTIDKTTEKIKGKRPIISYKDRSRIVRSIKYVDVVIPQKKIDEIEDYHYLKFDCIFKGDDWEGTEKWRKLKSFFKNKGVDVIFFPYTEKISSTKIRNNL